MDYKARKQEMIKMRNSGKSTVEIANIFGISRERVRQIIGNTGKDFLRNWTLNAIQSGKFDYVHEGKKSDLKKLPGTYSVWRADWGHHRHKAVGGLVKHGQEFEERASRILLQNGIPNELMCHTSPFDIKTLSGLRIDVKSVSFDTSSMPSQYKCKYPTYSIPHLRSGKYCDFFFVFLPDGCGDYTYFVIPATELHGLSESSRIRIPYPQMGRKPSKWHKYHKRIDLIY